MKCGQYKVRICSWVPFTRLIGSWSISTSGMGLHKTHWSLTQHPKPTPHLQHSHFSTLRTTFTSNADLQ